MDASENDVPVRQVSEEVLPGRRGEGGGGQHAPARPGPEVVVDVGEERVSSGDGVRRGQPPVRYRIQCCASDVAGFAKDGNPARADSHEAWSEVQVSEHDEEAEGEQEVEDGDGSSGRHGRTATVVGG